jgi:hypothetical protein
MLRRGSAQLLLLFFRSRLRLGWTLGAIAGVLVVAGLLEAGGDFPFLTRTGLAQVLRQSAWQHALAGLPEPGPWPWAATPAATTARVPLLGLSASIVKEGTPSKDERAGTESPARGSHEAQRDERRRPHHRHLSQWLLTRLQDYRSQGG